MTSETTMPLEVPSVGNVTRLGHGPVYIHHRAGENPSIIIDTSEFRGRRLIDQLEEHRFEGLILQSMEDTPLPGFVLDSPIKIMMHANSNAELLGTSQLLCSSDFNSVDDIIEVLEELAETLALSEDSDAEGTDLIELRGVIGELLTIRLALRSTDDENRRRAIANSHHRGGHHDYDFSSEHFNHVDSKVFGTSNPYRIYLTPEELHSNARAVIMIIGLRNLDYYDQTGFTLDSLWAEITELLPENNQALSDWIGGYLTSDIAQTTSFRLLDAHPPQAIRVGEIPSYDALTALESPYQRINEIPIYLDGAPALSQNLFANTLSEMGGT